MSYVGQVWHFRRERDVELEAEGGSQSEVRTRKGSATLCCVGSAKTAAVPRGRVASGKNVVPR